MGFLRSISIFKRLTSHRDNRKAEIKILIGLWLFTGFGIIFYWLSVLGELLPLMNGLLNIRIYPLSSVINQQGNPLEFILILPAILSMLSQKIKN